MTRMQREEIEERVLAVFRKNRRPGSKTLGLDTTFEELKLDSLDVISAVFDLEDEFRISIPDQGVRHLNTIRDAVDCIATLVRRDEPS